MASSPHWPASAFDSRKLLSSPVFLSPSSPRSPRLARTAESRPSLPPAATTLKALEHWVRHELRQLPFDAKAERLAVYRHCFNRIIGSLPAHGPLLAEIKKEYDRQVDDDPRGGSAARNLATLHPLQLPSSYYEAEWRRAKAEADLVALQRDRLQRLCADLRVGCTDARSRVHAAGVAMSVGKKKKTSAPIVPAATDGGAAGGGGPSSAAGFPPAAANSGAELDLEGTIGSSAAIVNDAMEAEIGAELQGLQVRLRALEARMMGAGRAASRTVQGGKALRIQLEEIEQAARSELQARRAAAPAGEAAAADAPLAARAKELSAALKMARTQEKHVHEISRMLEPNWEEPEPPSP